MFTPRTISAVRALKLFRLAAIGELAFFRSLGQARHFLLQALHYDRHIVDRLFHLFVVALVGLGNQLVDLAVGDLRQDAIAFANRQQNRVQHFVDALHDFAMDPIELLDPAALGETAFPGRVQQAA